MIGMSAKTGRTLSNRQHLAQSVADIVTTPLGSRVMRREYGSPMADLMDWPLNSATRLQAYAAIAMALMRWEPRLRITRVGLVAGDRPGQLVLTVEGEYTPTGKAVGLNAAFTARGAAA